MNHRLVATFATAVIGSLSLLTVPATTHATAAPVLRGPSIAWYVDHFIDLRVSWETAHACTSDNVTSSYVVGACAATFYDGAGGGAPVYPGGTGAFASSSVMTSGWDNRVSSVYIS
jgi:hypothetical protein